MGLKPNTWEPICSTLILLIGSFDPLKPIPDMTYNVFSGMLNFTRLSGFSFVVQTDRHTRDKHH